MTSILGIGLGAVLARVSRHTRVRPLCDGAAPQRIRRQCGGLLWERGSWAGAGAYFRDLHASPPAQPGTPPRPPQFLLADQNGVAITPAQPYRSGRPHPRRQAGPWGAGQSRRPPGWDRDRCRPRPRSARAKRNTWPPRTGHCRSLPWARLDRPAARHSLARNLTRPLRDLTQAIQAMMAGELKQEVPVRSADELGILTQAFNRLSADLARSNELRRQMTADIAHDLRTPLTVINAYIDGLRDGVFKPTPALRCHARRGAAPPAPGRGSAHPFAGRCGRAAHVAGAASCPALLERLAAAYAPQAEARGIALQVSAEPGLPEIVVDPERMMQVLGNLVTNALRYTPAGGRIALSARREGSRRPVRARYRHRHRTGCPAARLRPLLPRRPRANQEGASRGWDWQSPRPLPKRTGDDRQWKARSGEGRPSPCCCRLVERLHLFDGQGQHLPVAVQEVTNERRDDCRGLVIQMNMIRQ